MDLYQPSVPDNPLSDNIESEELTAINQAINLANLIASYLNGLGNQDLSKIVISPAFGSIGPVSLIQPGIPPTGPSATLPITILPPIPVPGDFIPVEYLGEDYPYPGDIVSKNLPEEILTGNEVQNYISSLLESVQDNLLDRLTTPGTGVSATVQALIYEREEIRSIASYLESRGRISTDLSSRGLDVPSNILSDSISSLDTKFHNIRSGFSREKNVKNEELTQLTTKQSLDFSVQLESHLMNYHQSFCDLLHENTMAMQRSINEIYRLWLSIYSFYQEAIKQYYQWVVGLAEIKIEYNKSVVLRYAAEVEYFSMQVLSAMNRVTIILKTYEADILRYKSLMDKFVANTKSNIKDLNAEVGGVVGRSNVSVMAADATVATNIDEAQYLVRKMISAGQSASIIASGCLASIKLNASAHTSISGDANSIMQHSSNYKES